MMATEVMTETGWKSINGNEQLRELELYKVMIEVITETPGIKLMELIVHERVVPLGLPESQLHEILDELVISGDVEVLPIHTYNRLLQTYYV